MKMKVDDWAKQGSLHTVGGHRFFVIDTGGDKPPLVVLHGYPTSSHDYHLVLPKLAERYRVWRDRRSRS